MTLVVFDFVVPHDHPSLAGHFPGRPLVPGVVLIDRVLGAMETHGSLQVTRLHRVKFLSALHPYEHAHGYWDLSRSPPTFRVWTRRGTGVVDVAQGAGSWAAAGPSQ